MNNYVELWKNTTINELDKIGKPPLLQSGGAEEFKKDYNINE